MDQSDELAVVITAKEINSRIAELKKQLSEIQSSCDHSPDIGFNKAFEVKKHCSKCDLDLGYPTTSDRDEFLKR